MIARSWIKPILASVFLVLPILGLAHSIQAYTTSNQPFTNPVAGVIPCYVDQAQTLMGKVVTELQGAISQTAINQINPQDLQALSATMTCAYQAALLGVQKVPAIVVDQQYVVYGNTDMTGAVAEILNAESHS